MDRLVERGDVGECLMSEVMRLEIMPDDLNVVEFGRVFGQPLNGEPVCPGGECRTRKFTDMDRAIVLDQHDRTGWPPRLGTVELIELFEMRHEVGATFGRAGVDDELARDVIERTQHGHFFGLSRGWYAQIGARLRPGTREIRMRQRLTFVTEKKNDIASFGLTLSKLQTQTDPVHFAGDLASLQRVPGPPPTEPFFRNALDSCERLIRTPSRASISARRRAIVQLVLSATGSSSNGKQWRDHAQCHRALHRL